MYPIYTGELQERLLLSFQRLHEKEYQLHKPMARDSGGWPGDWEGRALLGQVHLARALGKEPLYLTEICDKVFADVAQRGYYGAPVEPGICDEQQLSGNSWFLRSMCLLYRYRRDARALDIVRAMVQALLLPCRGMYRQYPNRPEDRILGGEASGALDGQVLNGWKTSSDIGCAFIMFDGATDAYELLLEEDAGLAEQLRPLLDEMAEAYLEIDFLKISAQTHATLAGLRGLLRYSRLCQKPALLAEGERIFRLYQAHGMTATFANANWFGRPDWTEPCAYIDSLVDAFLLFEQTKNPAYLEFVHQVYYNAIGYGQRYNGGFGLDNCARPEDGMLHPVAYEAYWCCTMRGADGLATLAEQAVQEGDTVSVYFYDDMETEFFTMKTRYPYKGEIAVTVKKDGRFAFYIPPYAENLQNNGAPAAAENGFFNVEAKAGQQLLLTFDLTLQRQNVGGKTRLMHGPLVLGAKGEADLAAIHYIGNGRYLADTTYFIPLNYCFRLPEAKLMSDKIQVLF